MGRGIAVILAILVIGAHLSDEIKSIEKKVISVFGWVPEENCACDDTDSSGASGPYIYGFDISQSNGDVANTINSNYDSLGFIIIKATEGVTFVDSQYVNNSKTIDSTKFVRGFYHFYRVKDDPIKQADWYLDTVKYFSPTALPPIVDLEYHDGEDHDLWTPKVMKGVLKFLKRIESKTGRKPMIYASSNFANKRLTDSKFADYPLWVANWRSTPPTLPGAWKGKKWQFWQKSDSYMIGQHKTDLDVFNGNKSDLQAFIKSTSKK